MTRFKDWTPGGVILAVVLPFRADFSSDWQAYRADLRELLRQVAAACGLDRDLSVSAAPLAAE